MSPSGIRTPPIYRNRWYLTSEVEALNRDFEYPYSAAMAAAIDLAVLRGIKPVTAAKK